MPAQKRHKTKYPGVYYIIGSAIGTKKEERIYYITYRKLGKQVHEKAGRQYQNDMTPARAAQIRSLRIQGKQMSNKERRQEEVTIKGEKEGQWTIDRIWQEYKRSKPSLKGIVTDENRYLNYIFPFFGDKTPSQISPLDIDSIRLQVIKSKKPGTVKNILELLRRIANFAEKKRLCEGMPFKIEMPFTNNLKTEDLTPDQLSKLLTAIENDTHPQAGAMMKIALFTGMRRGELFKLKWEHVDFQRGFILIKDPKGGPDQKIPLNEATKLLLDNHIKTDSPYVFPGRDGGQKTDINKAVNRIKNQAGLPKDFRPLHGLRHVYASMLASSGKVDMYTLQKLLTHKDPKMTQRYAHLRDETLKKASSLAGELINEAVQQIKTENKNDTG